MRGSSFLFAACNFWLCRSGLTGTRCVRFLQLEIKNVFLYHLTILQLLTYLSYSFFSFKIHPPIQKYTRRKREKPMWYVLKHPVVYSVIFLNNLYFVLKIVQINLTNMMELLKSPMRPSFLSYFLVLQLLAHFCRFRILEI